MPLKRHVLWVKKTLDGGQEVVTGENWAETCPVRHYCILYWTRMENDIVSVPGCHVSACSSRIWCLTLVTVKQLRQPAYCPQSAARFRGRRDSRAPASAQFWVFSPCVLAATLMWRCVDEWSVHDFDSIVHVSVRNTKPCWIHVLLHMGPLPVWERTCSLSANKSWRTAF